MRGRAKCNFYVDILFIEIGFNMSRVDIYFPISVLEAIISLNKYKYQNVITNY